MSEAHELLILAKQWLLAGEKDRAATALDRAFRLDPDNPDIRALRQQILDELAMTEHRIQFRYIPGGAFEMGSHEGDADELPIHLVQVDRFWISETPINWTDYCRLMEWSPPPWGMPQGERPPVKPGKIDRELFGLANNNKIRLQYCEDHTLNARPDWHAHAPGQTWSNGKTSQQMFGDPRRDTADTTWNYQAKPMVCVTWANARALCEKLNEPAEAHEYQLPTEAQWEKAARGGRIGARYAWGAELPTHDRCDFDRFNEFSILPAKRFPPNHYGLYTMSGGVWEWTADWYDAEFYADSPAQNPRGPSEGKQKVVRGGSWADCAEAITVSFRMALGEKGPPASVGPNIGFRLCRTERAADTA